MPPPATTERAGRGSALHRVGLLAAAAVLATACGAPPAPEGRVAPGLEQVRSHVGVEPSESRFWEQQPLRGRLEHLLGERLPTLVACLEAAGPLEEDSGVVHAFGAVEVAGGLHGAVLLVDPARDVVNVRLKINRAVQELHEDGVDLPTPEPVAAFFRSIDERLFAESRALGPSAEDDSPPAGDGRRGAPSGRRPIR